MIPFLQFYACLLHIKVPVKQNLYGNKLHFIETTCIVSGLVDFSIWKVWTIMEIAKWKKLTVYAIKRYISKVG